MSTHPDDGDDVESGPEEKQCLRCQCAPAAHDKDYCMNCWADVFLPEEPQPLEQSFWWQYNAYLWAQHKRKSKA